MSLSPRRAPRWGPRRAWARAPRAILAQGVPAGGRVSGRGGPSRRRRSPADSSGARRRFCRPGACVSLSARRPAGPRAGGGEPEAARVLPGRPRPRTLAVMPRADPHRRSLSSAPAWHLDGGQLTGFRGGDAPSVRKPSLAIREGALGYRTPQLLPLLCAWRPPRAAAFLAVGTGPFGLGPEWKDALPTAARASPHRGGGGSRRAGPASVAGQLCAAGARVRLSRRGPEGVPC